MRQKFVLRVRVLSMFAILIAIVLVVRLYFVQIVHGEDYAQAALGQYVEGTGEMPDRGEILFSTKTGETPAAATIQGGWRIAINPKLHEESAEETFGKLQQIVPLERERFFTAVAKEDDPYEEVAFRLTDDEAAAVRELEIQGVTTVRDEWRLYPAKQLASHALGFVAYRGETKAGVYGLERYWEDTLRKDGGGLYVNPFAEIFTNAAALVTDDVAGHEGSVITSLEPTVQRQLEDTLAVVMEAHTPK
ncbi:MAG: hypothetical protein WA021_01965, partial [Minisyncoccia bacterium]